MNVWVVIPTYNETANLELMVSAVLDKLDWSAAANVTVRRGYTRVTDGSDLHGRFSTEHANLEDAAVFVCGERGSGSGGRWKDLRLP